MAHAARSTAAFSTAHGGSFQRNIQNNAVIRSGEKPVDLVHLARQSLGDRSLEMEILNMFKSQSALYISRLENAGSGDERRMAAHTILGSARGIGAWAVARAAETVERHRGSVPDLEQLKKAVDSTNDYISELTSD